MRYKFETIVYCHNYIYIYNLKKLILCVSTHMKVYTKHASHLHRNSISGKLLIHDAYRNFVRDDAGPI